MTDTRGTTTIQEAEARRNHEFLSQFYGDDDFESDVCMGDKCTYKACEVCRANRFRLMTTDSYRKSVEAGYYTSGTGKKIDKITGKEKYFYVKPGE